MRTTARIASRLVPFAVVAAAVLLACLAARYAWASALLFTPDTPNPSPRTDVATTLDRASQLAPSNAIYRYWRSQRLHASMRARWLDHSRAQETGSRALDEASRAIELLRVNAYLHLNRAVVALDLARHPGTPDAEETSLVALAAADLQAALKLRPQSSTLLGAVALVSIDHWGQLREVDPELPLRAARLATSRSNGLSSRLIWSLWRALNETGPEVKEAITVVEDVVPEDSARAQRRLADFFRRLARNPESTSLSAGRAREVFEQAADAAEARAEAAETGSRR